MISLTDTLPRELRQAREAASLSQAEAAEWIGCSPRSYQAWEAGSAFPQPRYRRNALAFIRRYGLARSGAEA